VNGCFSFQELEKVEIPQLLYNIILALSISLKLDSSNFNYIVQLHLVNAMHLSIQRCSNSGLELIAKWP